MYRVLVIGTGYAGSAVAGYFRQKNQKVFGLTRSPERARALEDIGVTPVIGDLTRPETLSALPAAHFIVLSAAPDRRTPEDYRRIYVDGLGRALDRMRRNPEPHFVVYLSSTGVYGDRAGTWVDETAPAEPDSETGKILLEAEEQILKSGFPAAVLRLGGIYGPGRNRIDETAHRVPSERTDTYLNLIHRDDIVSAIPLLFNSPAGEIYLGVDDQPVRRSEFDRWLACRLGQPEPEPAGEDTVMGKRCRNDKLKRLGWRPRYRNYREGYLSLLPGAS